MSKYIVTEYTEETELYKASQFAGDLVEFAEDAEVEDGLTPPDNGAEQFETIVEFDEEEGEDDLLSDMENSLSQAVEGNEVGEPTVVEFSEELPGVEEEEPEVSSAADAVRMLPGSSMSLADDEEDKPDEKEDVPGTWRDDGDVRDFENYVQDAYSKIPNHDGTTILGCERAINYLKNLDREVSKAISLDKNMVLDVGSLDGYRVNMMNDMMTLKQHIKKLQRQIREQHGKKAFSDTPMKIAGSEAEFTKEATVARPQLIMTPFERAISGMIVNAVVSSGKSFEDVYELLKKKYAFTDREELAVMQLVSDMGYPIFKDRGSYGKDNLEIDFMKNYFA